MWNIMEAVKGNALGYRTLRVLLARIYRSRLLQLRSDIRLMGFTRFVRPFTERTCTARLFLGSVT